MQFEILGDRYQIQDTIGRGSMATIYRGRDIHTDRDIAIKVLRDIYSIDPKFVARFQREAKVASDLHHPNIVQVYDYGQAADKYYIVMELVRRFLPSSKLTTGLCNQGFCSRSRTSSIQIAAIANCL